MDRPFSGAGRPAKNPMKKVGRPVRCLVTQPVMEAIKQVMQQSGVTLSDALRLAIFNELRRRNLITEKLYNDPTWTYLKEKGLV